MDVPNEPRPPAPTGEPWEGRRADRVPAPSRPAPPAPPAITEVHGAVYGHAEVGGDAVAGDKYVYLPAAETAPPRQLPPDVPNFVGRGDDLARLTRLAEESAARRSVVIVAIQGMPGVGKTALAVHWAHRITDRFPDGQLFIDLRGHSDRAQVTPVEALGQLLRGLGVSGMQLSVEDEDELAAVYRSQLATKRMLVVLDNAASSAQVGPLLPGSPSCLVVVTSRTDLTGLVARHGARSVQLDVLPDAEARDLVRRIVGRSRADAEPQAVAELTRLCARLPLALRIAAANLAVRPQRTIAGAVEELGGDDRLPRLALEDSTPAVRAAFDVSYDSLSAEQQRALRYLGLLEGPTFTPDAVAALLAVTPEAALALLRGLEQANLVVAASPGRFRLHDLLREYARDRVHEQDDDLVRRTAVHRVATRYLSHAQDAGRFLDRHRRTLRQEIAAPLKIPAATRDSHLNWFNAERANLVAITRQIARMAQVNDGDRFMWDQMTWELADALYDFLDLRRYCRDNIEVQRLGLDAASRARHPQAESAMHHHLAVTYRHLGQYAAALGHAHQAHEVSRRIGDRYGESVALDNIARILSRLGRFEEALGQAEEALRIRREIGDRHGEAETLNTVARNELGLSRFTDALAHAEEALEIRRLIEDQRGEAETLDAIARIHSGRGRHAEALSFAGRSLEIRREIWDRPGEAESLALLGYLSMQLGRYPPAREHVQHALAIHRRIGNRRGEGESLDFLSHIHRRMGRYRQAVTYGLEALAILQELGDRRGEGQTLENLARTYRRMGLYEEALIEAERALEIRRRIGDRRGEAATLDALANIHRHLDRHPQALRQAEEALAIQRGIGDRHGEGTTLDNIAKIYLDQGELDRAAEVAQEALKIENELDAHYGRGVTLCTVGTVYTLMGRYDEAVNHIRQALDVRRDIGDRRGEAASLYDLAEMLRHQGNLRAALIYADQALQIQREFDDDHVLARRLRDLGHLANQVHGPQAARPHWEEALRILTQLESAEADEMHRLLAELDRQ